MLLNHHHHYHSPLLPNQWHITAQTTRDSWSKSPAVQHHLDCTGVVSIIMPEVYVKRVRLFGITLYKKTTYSSLLVHVRSSSYFAWSPLIRTGGPIELSCITKSPSSTIVYRFKVFGILEKCRVTESPHGFEERLLFSVSKVDSACSIYSR